MADAILIRFVRRGAGVLLLAAACAAPAAPPMAMLAAGVDIALPLDSRVLTATVPRGATLAALLRGHDLDESTVAAVVRGVASVFDPRLVKAQQPYLIDQTLSGRLRRFDYEIDGDRLLRVLPLDAASADAPAFSADVLPIPKTARTEAVRGAIDRDASSLFAALAREGEGVDLAVSLANVFGSELDFNTDLQPGDEFQLLVDKHQRSDTRTFAGYGPIQAASLRNDGRLVQAIRFTTSTGTTAYFDANGASLRRFFLRSPLKFEPVVTSAFSRSRRHPVLHVQRAHLGVDYRAPVGAPVVAVSDGVVVSAGWSGASGRMIHLRHANGFESQYLHLSSIAVRGGARVRQGDVIGRVGATGLVSGPHLDYRLKKNGAYINPVTAHRAMPPGDPVPATDRTRFEAERDRALDALRSR